MESGAVKVSTFTNYMKAAGGACIVIIVFLAVMSSVGSQAFANYWLSYWLNDGSGVSLELSTNVFVQQYSALHQLSLA